MLDVVVLEEEHEIVNIGNNGIQGYKFYKEYQPDLVLLDISISEKDDKDCFQKIINYDEDAKIVVISSGEEKDTLNECLRSGAKGYIEMPFNFTDNEYCEEFLETIEEALEEN